MTKRPREALYFFHLRKPFPSPVAEQWPKGLEVEPSWEEEKWCYSAQVDMSVAEREYVKRHCPSKRLSLASRLGMRERTLMGAY